MHVRILKKQNWENWENIKALGIRTQSLRKSLNFTKIGRISQHIKHLYGLMIGTPEKRQIGM